MMLISIVLSASNASAIFTQEIAQRAIIVAMTNCQSIDVFTDDGNHHDPTKYHSYTDETDSRIDVYEEGIWTGVDDKTWHVDALKLVMVNYETYIKVTCDITFDGTNYVLSNGTKIVANLKNLDSDDPSWQDIEEIKPSESSPYFTVSPELIKDDRDTE